MSVYSEHCYSKFNNPRTKDGTLRTLEQIFQDAATIGGMTRSKKTKTRTGVKDTFQDFFTGKLFDHGRKMSGTKAERQKLLDMFVTDELPQELISPVWRIKGTLIVQCHYVHTAEVVLNTRP